MSEVSTAVAELGQKIYPPGKKLNYSSSIVTAQGILCFNLIPGAPLPQKQSWEAHIFCWTQRARLLINIVFWGGGGERTRHRHKTVVKFLAGLIGERRARKAPDREEESEVGID